MTEDTSPENLRKFLESDDPAMVRMGLSLAKGAGRQGSPSQARPRGKMTEKLKLSGLINNYNIIEYTKTHNINRNTIINSFAII